MKSYMNETPCWKIRFTLVEGIQFRDEADGTVVFDAVLENGELCVSMLFSVRETPLCLRASAKPGEEAALIFYPWRAELYVGGVLCDEEWPYGTPLWYEAERTVQNTVPLFCDVPERTVPLAVTGSFCNAEGWRPGGGVYVGDCMPYEDGGRYHVLYLKDRHHHRSKWGLGAHQWEHLSTDDFVTWQMHPMAVEIDDPMEGSICTGSHIRVGETHYLYYTVRTSDGSPAPIRRSVSADGYHFTKDRDFGFTLDNDRYTAASARDPKVVCGADSVFHMFVTTTDRTLGRGALVHLTSVDGNDWHAEGNLYVSPDRAEPECPDYFAYGGRYYLIFSLYGSAHYRYSAQPFSDWMTPADDGIPCSSVPKAAVHDGRIVFTGFRGIDGYAGVMTFLEAEPDADGVLRFREMR